MNLRLCIFYKKRNEYNIISTVSYSFALLLCSRGNSWFQFPKLVIIRQIYLHIITSAEGTRPQFNTANTFTYKIKTQSLTLLPRHSTFGWVLSLLQMGNCFFSPVRCLQSPLAEVQLRSELHRQALQETTQTRNPPSSPAPFPESCVVRERCVRQRRGSEYPLVSLLTVRQSTYMTVTG